MPSRATSSPRRLRASALVVLLCLAALLGGCKKKKQATPPPAAQAPTITAPAPTPPAEAAPTPAAPAATETQPAATAPAAAPKPKPQSKHRAATKKQAPAKTPPAEPAAEIRTPGKVIVPEGGTAPSPTKLAPDLAPAQAIETRQSTAALLEATENNLKSMPRQLTADEQAMVEQIRTYMAQSRAATDEGDLVRARNLADKAHQLSEALLKRD